MTIQIREYSHTIYFKLFSGMNFSSATGEAQASEPRVDADCGGVLGVTDRSLLPTLLYSKCKTA